MKLRPWIFWPHLIVALAASVVIASLSLTGLLLTYELQLTRWWSRTPQSARPSPEAAPLPLPDLVARITDARGQAPARLTVENHPDAPVYASFGRRDGAYVSAYTGQIVAGGPPWLHTTFDALVQWHRWFGRGRDSRGIARQITGAGNLAFLFLIVTGVYLWFPRKAKWKAIRAVLIPRRGLKGHARDFNWHNALGFWALVPLFLIVWSGAAISYPWFRDVSFRTLGLDPPARRRGPRRPPEPATSAPVPSTATGGAGQDTLTGNDTLTTSELWTHATAQRPNWTRITCDWPLVADGKASFSIDTGTGRQPQHRATVILNATTGEVVETETWADTTPERKLRSYIRFVHTGEYYGVLGQTIAGLASLIALVLVWTGVALSIRRFWPKRRAPAEPQEQA